MKQKIFGGALLVSGTTIGAAMLALPVTTSFIGFFPSILLFLFSFALMLITAFFFLDVNLAFVKEVNLISMAGKTLGKGGQAVSWIVYLLLLYSLLAAYIAGSSPIFQEVLDFFFGASLPRNVGLFCLPFFFAGFVYLGFDAVDKINRFLMIGLIFSYLMLILFVPSHVEVANLTHMDLSLFGASLPVVFTSFGFHIIIPTLVNHIGHNRSLLVRSILWGSGATLIVYVIWQWLVLGVVPMHDLVNTWKQGGSGAIVLSQFLHNPWIALAAKFFAFFAIVTSFLGVSMSLADFLTDGLNIKKSWEGRLIAVALTFVPPIIFVFSYPRGFILALEYAGAFVAILLGVMPALMSLRLPNRSFKLQLLAYVVILVSLGVVVVDIMNQRGFFASYYQSYLTPGVGI